MGPTFESDFKESFDPSVCTEGDKQAGYIRWREGDFYGCTEADGKLPRGKGQLINERGTYTGYWDFAQRFAGEADIKRSDGKTFKGRMERGKEQGFGELYDENTKYYYKGKFVGGDFDGKYDFIDDDGNVYKGEWYTGKRNVWGSQTYDAQPYNTYVGEWDWDKWWGFGVKRSAVKGDDNDPNKYA